VFWVFRKVVMMIMMMMFIFFLINWLR
jgi:hypothetical protein